MASHGVIATIALLLLPLPATATLETEASCNNDLCWSVTKHRSERVTDYYSYNRPHGLRHVVIRYDSGALVSILVHDLSPDECAVTGVWTAKRSPDTVHGRGCIVTKSRDKAVRLDYMVKAADIDAFLHKVAPVAWLSGYSESGDYLPAASIILPFDEK